MKALFRIAPAIGIALWVLITGGCGGNKVYAPPKDEVTSKIVLVNTIYQPGFYVELDKQQAGYLNERLEIRVAPGKYKVKVFNKETAFTDKEETKQHKFDLKVEIGQGEVKEIVLSWDDECYDCDVRTGSIRRREDDKKKKGGRSQPSAPGMPGM
jgi:hypothetical protein